MNIKTLLVALFCVCFHFFVTGGNDVLRYSNPVFTQVKTDSIAYCTRNGVALLMDIYQPVGDTAGNRPLIILAHGGSFIHGNRKCDCMPRLCKQLAQRGYVVASIDYRLTTLLNMATKRKAFTEITKAVADGRSSVNWFLNDAAHGNRYRINPSKIFFGGSSAGGILAEHLAYIQKPAQCGPVLCDASAKYLVDSNAWSAHAICGCISLAGGILDTNLIIPGATPILHIQGDADLVVPFGCKRPVHGLAPFKLWGLGGSLPRYQSQGIKHTEYVFKHGDHTPWDTDDTALKIVVDQIAAFAGANLNQQPAAQ